MYDQLEKKIIISKYIIFDETSMLKPWGLKKVKSSFRTIEMQQKLEFDATLFILQSFTSTQVSDLIIAHEEGTNNAQREVKEAINQEVHAQESIIRSMTNHQNIIKLTWLRDHIIFTLSIVEIEIPYHYKEAINSLDSDLQRGVMDEEIESLHKNVIWRLVKLSPGKKNQWVQMRVCKKGWISQS